MNDSGRMGADVAAALPLDGASANALTSAIWDEMADQRTIAADPARPLSLRLEAFEDIVDSEVGDTQLSRARNVERQLGWRQIYL